MRWTVQDSNFNAPESDLQATITPRDDGGSKHSHRLEPYAHVLHGAHRTLAIRMSTGWACQESFKEGAREAGAASQDANVVASGATEDRLSTTLTRGARRYQARTSAFRSRSHRPSRELR